MSSSRGHRTRKGLWRDPESATPPEEVCAGGLFTQPIGDALPVCPLAFYYTKFFYRRQIPADYELPQMQLI